MPVVGNLVLAAGFLALAIPVIGFAEPAVASGIARITFGITAASGFALVFYFWRRGDAQAETALVSWSAILLWSFLALIAVLADERRRGIARALLSHVLGTLHLSGIAAASAEADESNKAALALLEGIGGRRTSSSLELAR